jgi:MFS family permease
MADKADTKIFYGWVMVAAASIILSLQWGCIDTYGIFLTELCGDLDWTRTAVSGAYSLFAIVSCLVGVIAGRLNDRYGPRLILMISIIVMGVGYALMSTLDALWQLYIFYGVIVAIGASFGWVPAISTVSRWFTRKRGAALGATEAGIGIGSFIMPPLAQFLIIKFGWRASYSVLAGLLFIIGLPVTRLMRLNPSEKGLYPDGIKETTESKRNSNLISDTADFTLRQAIRTKEFWLLFALYTIAALPFGILIHLKAYMISFGISEMTAATTIGISSGAFAVGALVISKLSDRIGRKVPLFISLLALAVMMLWLMKAREPWEFYLFSIISGFGWGGTVLFPAIIADWFGMKSHGSIYGVIDIGWGFGGGIAPLLAGYIFDTTGDYELAIVMAAISLFLAMGLSLVIKPPHIQK